MFNSGVRGRRAPDNFGTVSSQTQFVQQKSPQPSITGWSISGSDDTALSTAGGQTVLVNGTGFASGAAVTVNGQTISPVTVISPTQLSFTSIALAGGSYSLIVYNSTGGAAILVPGLIYSAVPTWTTAAGSIGTTYETTPISTSVVATSDSAITYSLVSGSLPSGATLYANGVITGTSPVESGSTTYTFAIKAEDAELQDTTRTFTLTINTDVVTWSSPANNTTYTSNANVVASNVVLSATSAAGYGITYTANTLPTGLSLTGNTISGTPTVVANSSTLLTATASTTNRSATRTINWVIQLGSDLYFNLTTLLLNGETSNNYWIQDASTNKFAVTVVGDTRPSAFSPYETVWSNYFDGSGDYLTAPASFTTSGTWTIEGWCYFTNSANNDVFLNASSDRLYIQWLGTTFYLGDASINNISFVSKPINVWFHLAVVKNSSTYTVYFNGAVMGTSTSALITDTVTTWQIGARTSQSIVAQGYISNLRIVSGTALYTSAFTPPTSPLTAISGTTLLTCQSNRLIDNSTNNYTITKIGDTKISNFSPFTETELIAGSGYFDGTGDYLTVSANVAFNFGSDNFTIEFWFYRSGIKGNSFHDHLIGNRPTSFSNTQWHIYVGPAAGGVFAFQARTSSGDFTVSGGTCIENSWNHIALVRNSNVTSLYVNGISVGTPINTSAAFGNSTDPISIGAFTDGAFPVIGYFSNMRIVKGTAVYTSNFTPPTSPLTAVANTSLLTLQNRFGESSNRFVDTSGMNSIVTKFANATQGTFSPFSQTGWSGYFTGSSTSYISTPSTTILNQGQTYTVQCWIYPTVFQASSSAVRRMYIFVKGVIYAGLSIHSDGTLGWYGWPTPGGIIVNSAAGTITTNVWQHVALVVNPGNYIKLFKNGVEVGSSAYTAAGADGSAIQIGNGDTGASGTDGFIGYISNFKITQSALTAGQLDYSASPVISSATNAALLVLQTNRFNDTGFNNLAITVPAAPSIQSFSPFSPAIITPISYSGNFDGTGDYLSTAPSGSTLNFGTGDFCVEAWVYSTQTDSTQLKTITGNYVTNSSGHWQLLFNSIAVSGDRKVGVYIGSPQGWLITSTSTLSFNTWNHIAFTRSGTTVRLFINGTLDATVTSSATIGLDSSAYQIGAVPDTVASFPTRFWMGYISNVRYVKGSAVYTSTFTPSTTPLTAIANTSLLTCQSSRFIDNSTNNFTITVNGDAKPTEFNPFSSTSLTGENAAYSIANVSGSMYFDGNGDYLAVANNSDAFNCGTSNFTIEFWYYDDGNSVLYPNIISSTDWATGTGGVGIRYNNTGQANKFSFFWYGVGDPWLTTPGTFPGKAWNHVAVVRSGNTFTLYVNGVSQASNTNSGTINWGLTSGGPKVGGGNWDGANSWTKGWISNLRLIKGSALYTSAFAPSATPLTSISNTTLLLNGTNSGIIDYTSKNILETVGNTQLSTIATKFGSASMSFDGTGDYLAKSTDPQTFFGTGDFTFECWVYPTVLNTYNMIFGYSSPNQYWSLRNTGYLHFYDGSSIFEASTGAVQINQWTHVAISRSGSTMRQFVNGTQVLSSTCATSIGSASGASVWYGASAAYPSQHFYTGYIDDFRITKGYARYTTNFTAPTSAFITY